MMRHGTLILLPLFLMLIIFGTPSWGASDSAATQKMEVTLDFQNVELVDMIRTISELTGKNFIYDESVRGKVSVVSPQPVSVDEAYDLFNTVLNVKGFTIVPAGEVNKIVSVRTAKEENLPTAAGTNPGGQYTTRLIPLQHLDATTVVDTILRPLMPKTSYVVAHVPTNTLVISDSNANIERMVEILSSLDRVWENEQMEIINLKFGEAEETAELISQILEGGAPVAAANTRRVRRSPVEIWQKIALGQVIPYARTNKLLVLGDKKYIDRVKEIVAEVDVQADQGRSRIQVYYLEHAEAEGLSETLNKIMTGEKQASTPRGAAQQNAPQEAFGKVVITADKPTNSLIINSSSEDYEGIKQLIGSLDIKRKQVFVEALILEVSMDAMLQLGASLQGAVGLGDESLTFGTSNLNKGSVGLSDLAPGTGTTPPLLGQAVSGMLLGGMFSPVTTVGPDGSTITIPAISALIQLSQTDTNVNVLSAPRLLTSDNEEAEIVVGSNVPIITSKSKDNDGNPINSVERKDVALTLRFTPQITEGNLVRLKIYQEISDVVPSSQTVGTVDEVGPTFSTRKLSNLIVAQDGKTVVLGGLFQTTKNQEVSKVPLLGDIPLLGALFRSKSDQEKKTSLLVFITPRVIRTSEDLDRVTRENRASLDIFNTENGSESVFEKEQSTITQPASREGG